jgi:predicted membrane GTPase involved in stress response
VGPPRVLLRADPDRPGAKAEPLEEVACEVDDAHAGPLIQDLAARKGEVSEAATPACCWSLWFWGWA